MEPLVEKKILTSYGEKSIAVYAQDIAALTEPIDVLAVSSFYRGYAPTPKTLIGALSTAGISVQALSGFPEIDLREQCNIWLSRSVGHAGLPIGRIGCIEMSPYRRDADRALDLEKQILSSIQAYFHMLHIASLSGISMETIALPILGAGNQQIDPALITIPLLNECLRFLKSNESVRRIWIISKNHTQAFQFAMALEKSYSAAQETKNLRESASSGEKAAKVFISYSSGDRPIADSLCAKLETRGVKVWYAPRDIYCQDYASAIVDAISHCSYFVVILSRNAQQSHHVLNEIDLAFRELNRHIRIIPLRIDEQEMRPAFLYYLSRLQWEDAITPPLEKRLEEFASSIVERA